MRARFVLSEVGVGLRRNLTMTVAVILTVAVSLTLFGTSLLLRSQVDLMKDFWYDRVEVSIFLCLDNSQAPSCKGGAVTEAQKKQILADLEAIPVVEEVFFESQQEAYDRFREQFAGSPILDNVTPKSLPSSFRVKLKDPEQYRVISSAFAGRDGIEQVQDQRRVLDRFFGLLNSLQTGALYVAIVMLAVLVLLVVNTIRVAAFSRRRETGIMKLVGASNLYIQAPFLAEAAIAAFIGSLLSFGLLASLKHFVVDQQLSWVQFTTFIGWDAVIRAGVLSTLIGVGLSVVAAFLTLRKYLRV